MSILLDHVSRTNGRHPSIFYNISGQFAHELHYIGVSPLPRGGMRKKRIATLRTEALKTHN
jgi:hypothetical protein